MSSKSTGQQLPEYTVAVPQRCRVHDHLELPNGRHAMRDPCRFSYGVPKAGPQAHADRDRPLPLRIIAQLVKPAGKEACTSAPRSMKMGTIASLWRYGAA